MAKSKTERGRFSSRKMEIVLRVLRGDDLDLVSREAGMTAATVSAWRDQFVASSRCSRRSLACRAFRFSAPMKPSSDRECRSTRSS